MGQDESQERAQQLTADEEKSPEQLRAEIEDVRADLGDTAAALAAKTDIKTRARDKAEELKRTATAKKEMLLSKIGRDGSASTADGPSALTQAKAKAREKPVLTASLGALIGGYALGRLTRRNAR